MIKAIVIGASFGGMDAVKKIITDLPDSFQIPIVVVLHIGNNNIDTYMSILEKQSHYFVKEAEEKESLKEQTIYFAPPNYHLLVEEDFTLSLSTDEKVNFSRPAIDVLFETAAWSIKNNLIGLLLTGSNNDGATGLKTIKNNGGITIVQDPETAHSKTMPESAIKLCNPDYILNLKDIAAKIIQISENK